MTKPDRSERKLVTIMFADFSGFTALASRLDPEDVRGLMNDCFDALVPPLESYGGVVDKFIGDEIMALFGAPQAHENHAERALCAALDMLGALAEFNRRRGVDLEIHFGINSGLVVTGGLGSEGRRQYSVVGDAVNLAARLRDAATRGTVLVGPTTHRLVREAFDFDRANALILKGIAKPVAVHRLAGRRSTRRRRRSDATVRAEVVGRDRELDVMRGMLHSLPTGTGGVLSIVGEPGIGKSRLVSELRRETRERIWWAEGRAQSHTQSTAFSVARSLLDDLVGIPVDAAPPQALATLRQFSRNQLLDSWSESYPYLARLRDLPLESEHVEILEQVLPAALQRRMHDAFRLLVRACARDAPVVLVWEDLQWSDPSSLQLLESLRPLVASIPLLLLLVSRPDERDLGRTRGLDDARDEARTRVIELAPLQDDDGARLIANLLGVERVRDEPLALILSRAEGNPFFLEELLRSLLESGQWKVEAGDVIFADPVFGPSVPDTVQGVVADRIDRLSGEHKRTLQLAAIVGRIFAAPLLRDLIRRDGSNVSMDEALSELRRRDFVRRRTDQEYIFKHAITRDVAYETLLMAHRRRLHRLAAESVQELFADRIDEMASTVALHYQAAQNHDKAGVYFVRAGDRAQRDYANSEAIGFYRAAIAEFQAGDVPRPDGSEHSAAAMHEKLGIVLSMIGDADGARSAFDSALHEIFPENHLGAARLTRRLGLTYNVARHTPQMLKHYDRASDRLGPMAATRSPAWRSEWLELQLEYGWVFYLNSRLTELQALGATLAPVVEQYGSASQRARFFETLVIADLRRHRFRQIPDSTLHHAERIVASAAESGFRHVLGRAISVKGFVHLWRDELVDAEALFHEGLRIAQDVGDVDTQLGGLNYLALVGRKRDDLDMAGVWAGRALSLATFAKSPLSMASALGSRGWVAWREGDEDAALRHLRAAREAAARYLGPFPLRFLFIGPELAIAVRREEWPAALEYAASLLEPIQQRMPEDVETALVEAKADWEGGRTEQSVARLAEGVRLMREHATGYV